MVTAEFRGAHPRSRGENSLKLECDAPLSGSSPLTRGKHRRSLGRSRTPVAHPRSRGENGRPVHEAHGRPGSSPLTRGKRFRVHGRRRGHRLIPAHAGKTLSRANSSSSLRAHPRSRGENMVSDGKVSLEDGSSPLTRGKRPRKRPGKRPSGLIPAHAGKTAIEEFDLPYEPAHPRSRGENASSIPRAREMPGSSPLTRGKRRSGTPTGRTARLIPAHAGKTFGGSLSSLPMTAHPRSRGENTRRADPGTTFIGSSPLTRGKHYTSSVGQVRVRLIPAHAGKTLAIRYGVQANPAHPRSRGENRLSIGAGDRRAGSSPLTRGKLLLGGVCHCRVRLIPAHAGKTRTLWPGNHAGVWLIPAHAGKTGVVCGSPGGGGAHPRSRGENRERGDASDPDRGSSPLTRGKQGSAGVA